MTVWVGTSWKMTKTRAEARAYAAAVKRVGQQSWPGVQAFVIPPATALAEVSAALAGTGVLVGAQNAHWETSGPWTGELSAGQVKDAGATLVEIGHSERREFFGETDRTVNLKVHAALREGLLPLVCVGEPRAVLNAGGSVEYVAAQVDAALDGVTELGRVLIAYEPIWAIGEHGRPARPEDIGAVFRMLQCRWGERVLGLLYGGSVARDNAIGILETPGVTGLFIGRAAWTADGFIDILRLVARGSSGCGGARAGR